MFDRLSRLFSHDLYFEERDKRSLVLREPACYPAAIFFSVFGLLFLILALSGPGNHSLAALLAGLIALSILAVFGVAMCVDSTHLVERTGRCLIAQRRLWRFR